MVTTVTCRGASGEMVLWNVSAEVGRGKTNRADDVELARLGYFYANRNPAPSRHPAFRTALAAVKPTGGFADDLDACIRAHEAARGGPQDGYISVMKHASGQFQKFTFDHKHQWIVVHLNAELINHTKVFPRIDLIPECGLSLKATVAKICTFF